MVRKVLGGALTTFLVVAALGLVSWFVYAHFTGASLVTFRTGSMAPTMPQGALAITVPVDASELAVGDVITVQRGGASMPVTHRIIDIGPVQNRPDNAADIRAAAPGLGPPDLTSQRARQVQMRGDDNATPDRLPYALTSANKVLFAIPNVGRVLMVVQSPLGMGVMTLLVAGMVVWAFWPSTPASRPTRDSMTA